MVSYLPYERFDESRIWRIHKDYFQTVGLKAWRKGHIPYSGVSNFTEAYKKARLFVSNLISLEAQGPIRILEVGAGFGEFAKNFISAFREICVYEGHDFFERLEYHISDFSQTTLDELAESGRLDEFKQIIQYKVFDALDRYSGLEKESYDLVMANYLLDQFPARIVARSKERYFEKYLSIEDPQELIDRENSKGFWLARGKWVKRLKKRHRFVEIDIDDELPMEHREILETCFRKGRDSSVVYSYGSLAALRNFLILLKPNGLIVCSDFNAASKPGMDACEPCYYGNSVAQAVNFEFLFKYFKQTDKLQELKHLEQGLLGYQMALIYEDPVKPLHTMILTRPDYCQSLELGMIYQKVYHQNWLLRTLYKFLVEMQLGCYVLLLFMLLYLFIR